MEAELKQILELMNEPAFCASEGLVIAVNDWARELGLCSGQTVESLLKTGADDYADFRGGVLFLSLETGGTCLTARVSKFREVDLFCLEPEEASGALQALALAAQSLRKPLGNVMAGFGTLADSLSSEDEHQAEALCRMNRGFYQMLRLVNNMSDASSGGAGRMEIRNVTAVLREVLSRCEVLLENTQIRLEAKFSEDIYSRIDSQKLERAVYNLISNAVKYTPGGGSIQISLTRRGRAMVLSVTNDLPEGTALGADSFFRYLRNPSLGSGQDGLGLGIPLVRSVAQTHGGTLLMQQTDRKMQAVIRIPICQDSSGLRSPALILDQDGGYDRALVELSDVLPPELFAPQ